MQISDFLRDGDGAFSSKRLFALFSGALVIAAAVGNMWFGVKIDEFIFDGLMLMALGGIGGVATENVATAFFNRARGGNSFSDSYPTSFDQESKPLIGREKE